MRYFIGNWKMFGVPKSINILNKINSFRSKDKNRNKYRIIITPPYTLIELKNNLKIIFCIVENKIQKKKNRTFNTLRKQLTNVLEKKLNKNNIIIAYEPIWSIGTGKIPTSKELLKTTIFIKKVLKKIFGSKSPAVLYGGSVDENNVGLFRKIREIDGFLIGGASKSSKKFIDIIKNYYR